MSIPDIYSLQTSEDIYKIKITKDIGGIYSYDAIQRENGVILNIGGRNHFCVQIQIPYEGETGQLMRVESAPDGVCSIIENSVKGERLIHMVHLGITVAREINTSLKWLELLDSASFPCSLPGGKRKQMNSSEHDLAFYQESYYEKRYGAVLIDDTIQREYMENKKGFTDPIKKKPLFHFGNRDIETELLPLYNETHTWKDFFDTIRKKYTDTKCTVVTAWLKEALLLILKNRSYSGLKWKIDITNKPRIYYEQRVYMEGGKNKNTRKKSKQYKKEPFLADIYEMDWKTYFNERSKYKI